MCAVRVRRQGRVCLRVGVAACACGCDCDCDCDCGRCKEGMGNHGRRPSCLRFLSLCVAFSTWARLPLFFFFAPQLPLAFSPRCMEWTFSPRPGSPSPPVPLVPLPILRYNHLLMICLFCFKKFSSATRPSRTHPHISYSLIYCRQVS